MRSARRAASPQLGQRVAEAHDADAQAAYANAQAWAARTKEAVEAGDDAKARMYADNAKQCAAAARAYARGRKPEGPYPDATDPAALNATPPPPPPEEARTAAALAGAAGIGARARVMPPRADGGQTAAWNDKDFGGAATVYPGTGDEPPHARVAFTRLDRDRYQALADSPWPYRVENGTVIYDRVPVDHAEQIIHAAASRRAARPWERHGLTDADHRDRLDSQAAGQLHAESRAWAENLNGGQRKWVKKYSGSSYATINRHLYQGGSMDEPAPGLKVKMRTVTKNLDTAIAAAGTAETAHRTYRGFTPPMDVRSDNRVSSWVRENFAVGSRYRDDSYMSVSHCPSVAAGFTDTSWKQTATSAQSSYVKHGHADYGVVFETVSRRGAALADISIFGNAERERLMPRGAEWVVVGIQEGVTINGRKHMVVQMCDAKDSHRY
ncbi:ADP-ribosyltransferase [Streptomyces sp. NPDC090741]|uniref:ADP-ribosyltransferase n=1 Tax=Streptomyces sp. NPDC090741 TaxID=3365967 RepID=UPI0037F37375